ncbi:hypothetical protein MSG28_008745 [Choristoneura fumiferana]|uniref:Uncharacterized protein n=2 Tax=Choristoneura fumiferana TaxID=7141 RepID=A0ACC0J7Z5_CHOFU|nr:hypothetical protein MSG28_008745 [Choristoneura fumiferana]
MTIKNKKTKSKTSEVASTSASSSVQKSSTSTTVQQSSNTLQKVSSGKKVRYIEVKVEDEDPLMITDISDHTSLSGSTISEAYNSHPHYIIAEAPSISDLSQTRLNEHHVSDMVQSTTGEFVSSSQLQSSSSHQESHNTTSETFQSSSTSVQRSASSHSQFDKTMDSTGGTGGQKLNTGFIDNSSRDNSGVNTKFLSKSQSANSTNSFLDMERQELISQSSKAQTSATTEATSTSSTHQSSQQHQQSAYQQHQHHKNNPTGGKITGQNYHSNPRKVQTVTSDSSNFYGGEGTLDRNVNSKQYSSTSHTSEAKSSSVTKSSSSSYVVEIVDGKERIIDNSSREWGDAKEQATSEAYASISGIDIKPQSVHSVQNYDMKSKYDTGKPGQKPSSEMTIKEGSKLVKDGNQITTHSSVISEKDNVKQHQISTTQEQLTSSDKQYNKTTSDTSKRVLDQHHNVSTSNTSKNILDQQHNTSTFDTSTQSINQHHDVTSTHVTDQHKSTIYDTSENVKKSSNIVESTNKTSDSINERRKNQNQTDSSNFYGYDTTIQNELEKVGNILNVGNIDNLNFSTKIMKSNTSSAQEASTSSYRVEIIDGVERIVDSSHREWGDSKDHSTYERSHNISGTGIKPEHEYRRHVLDKESHYDTGKKGVPTSSSQITEESLLVKDGKEIASTSNTYIGDFTKKKAITEHTDSEDILNKRIQDVTDKSNITDTTTHRTTTSDNQSSNVDIRETTEFVNTEKHNLSQETSSTSKKDTLTTYEQSTGTWNGKFTYETDDDRPKRPKQMSPFGRPEQPRHHLKRQDTEENIILSSRDIKDFTSITDLRKIIESSQHTKDVTVSDKSIVIKRNIDDRVLKDILETVKKYPFKRIEKVTFGTKINEDVKDLYEGIDTEHTTVINTSNAEVINKSFNVEKTRSQVEVVRYVKENGITTRIVTYEDAKEDDKVKTNVYVDNTSSLDVKNLSDVRTTKDVLREYDVVDHAITEDTTTVRTVYDETIDRKTVRDDQTIIDKREIIEETRPRGPKKPEKIVTKEQCICEICTCG